MTLWAVAFQALLSMRFPRQEYWSGLPFPSPGDLPDPRIEPGSPALQVVSLRTEPPGRSLVYHIIKNTSPFFSQDFPGGADGKASTYNVGDPGSIPGLGRSSGEGNGNPLQYSCLENPMDRGAW